MANGQKIVKGLRELNAEDQRFEIVYSSINSYLESVYEEAKSKDIRFDVAEGDFWRYTQYGTENAFWSGYYSTYPLIKYEIMQFSDFVQSVTQVLSLYSVGWDHNEHLELQKQLLETNSIMMHHDAITGTHKKKVGEDYSLMMSKAIERANTGLFGEAITKNARL